MLFLRYQEYYESSNPDFKGKIFKIIDFMDWYSEKHGGGAFTYCNDFGGYNIPQKIIQKIHYSPNMVDTNHYDFKMDEINKQIKALGCTSGYIIGIKEGSDINILQHELAHGLYYTNIKYKRAMNLLLDEVDANTKKKFFKILKSYTYDESVYLDEMQAYLSTGIITEMRKIPNIENTAKPFIALFAEYRNNVLNHL